jgi:hypothetical protein
VIAEGSPERCADSALRAIAQQATPDPLVTIASLCLPVTNTREKAALADRLDADLADCESMPVVQAADAAGAHWLIIRGVSDGPEDALPELASEWIDDRGRARLSRLSRDVLLQPWMACELLRLARASSAAMRAAARLTTDVLAAWQRDALRSSTDAP